MKQRWLIESPRASDSTLTVELDPQTRVALVALMATAIESVHHQHANATHPDKEPQIDERTTTKSQD